MRATRCRSSARHGSGNRRGRSSHRRCTRNRPLAPCDRWQCIASRTRPPTAQAAGSAPPNTQSRPPAMCTTPPIGNRCQARTAIGSASRPTTLTATWSAGAGVQRRSAPGYPAIVRGRCVDCASSAPLSLLKTPSIWLAVSGESEHDRCMIPQQYRPNADRS